MSLVVVGLNHRSAPLELIERTAIGPSELTKALHDLAERGHLAESIVLSTCNRTEIYSRATKFHPAVQEMCEFLASWADAPAEAIVDHVYTYHDDAAVMHLFGVAAGVDSLILGEHEVMGQVRQAWSAARAEGSVRQGLDRVFRHALEVGKRVRTETAIGRGSLSVPHAAVEVAASRLGSLAGLRALVVGAGVMGEGLVRAVQSHHVSDLAVANRTAARAEALAAPVGARVLPLDAVPIELADVDVVFSATGAAATVLTRDQVEAAVERRGGRPLLMIDIAVPRDVDPGAGEVVGVTLLDMSHLEAWSADALAHRRAELPKVRAILSDELERHRIDAAARQAAPVVASLRARAEEIRQRELDKAASRLSDLDDRERDAVEAVTRAIVNKLLHEPTVRVKSMAGTADGVGFTEALATLFDLDT
jgi:glutamyl-tRNA reductase